MNATMYDLKTETLPDGGISLMQSAGSLEEPAIIDLHPMQIRLIAEQAGLLSPIQQTPFIAPSKRLAGGSAMQQLEIDIEEDGMIRLLQTRLQGMGGSDEEIELHPMQAAWLAERLLQAVGARPSLTVSDTALERLQTLRELVAELYFDQHLLTEVMERCCSGFEVNVYVRMIHGAVEDLATDLGLRSPCLPERVTTTAAAARNDNLSNENHISVTDSAKRGRPPTGEAMSNTERQARFREKQKQQELSLEKVGAGEMVDDAYRERQKTKQSHKENP